MTDVFCNYNQIYNTDLSFKELFDDFGKKYISKVFSYKDKRITRGKYNGYELNPPEINPTIILKYNNEDKDLSKISPGEKADILLDLILDPNSSKILIIDQPEDDLDNETIFNKVVSKLRTIKLRRQVIVISHNANIVINGDSDKIIVCMKNDNNYNIIYNTMESSKKYEYSSINSPKLNDNILNISTHILDGGKDALAKRVKKIGYTEIFFKENDINEDNCK